MGVRHHGDGAARRNWPRWRDRPGIVVPVVLLAAGVLVGAPAAVVAVAPAAASPVSPRFSYACGTSFIPGKAHCGIIRDTAVHPAALTAQPGVIPAGSGFGPSDLQAAYGLTSASAADGAGSTVAVVDAFDDPTAASDLAAYRSAAGLPALTTGQFTVYNQDGQTSPLPAEAPAGADDWTAEESLDVDMVSAICPLCKIELVEANNDSAANLLVADGIAALALGARYVSDSWGFTEISGDTAIDSTIFSVPGVVYVAGSGDSGYGTGDVVYPAASPNVVSVGGTTLAKDSSSRGWTEGVWFSPATSTTPVAGTGSGCSAAEPQPSWQASVSVISAACQHRVENDVAADADPNAGAAVYDTSNGNTGWFMAGGTSESTPIIAATFALAGNDGNGGNNAAKSIYADTADLNEVTAGSNGTCAQSVLCTATGAAATYNGPTGWGTPNGIKAFASIGNTITVAFPGNQTGTAGTAVSGLQISGTDSASGQTLTYTAAGLPAGLSISSSGLISGTPTTAGVDPVTVTATDATGASGSASFLWGISPGAGGGSTPTATASPGATCSPSATASTSPSARASASSSASSTASPSASSTASSSTLSTIFGSAVSDCSSSPGGTSSTSSTSAGSTPTTSATASPLASPSSSSSSPAAAPSPSAVTGNLPVTG